MIERKSQNIKLFGLFYFLFKNKYVNYQTLIKLIKKLLCFVIIIIVHLKGQKEIN